MPIPVILERTFLIVTAVLWNIMFILQLFEWTAMLYIIRSQADRSVGEIYYDHNAENIDDKSVHSNQVQYRRREIRLEKTMKVIIITIFFTQMFLNIAFKFDREWNIPLVMFYITELVILFYLFYQLF